MHPSISLPLSLTSRVTFFFLASATKPSRQRFHGKMYFGAQGTNPHPPVQRSSCLAILGHAGRTMRRYPPGLVHGGSRSAWCWTGVGGPGTNRQECLLDVLISISLPRFSCSKTGLTHPCLRSFRRSTKMSKSMALGESKSYSFLCAKACCTGVKVL